MNRAIRGNWRRWPAMLSAAWQAQAMVILTLGAIVGPFNFPGMIPFWFLPYALASGNTVAGNVLNESSRNAAGIYMSGGTVSNCVVRGNVGYGHQFRSVGIWSTAQCERPGL